jgi:tetratricopeptide (TPR) repeat protein
MDKGDYAAAEPLFRQALAIRRKLFGEKHPSVIGNMSNLAASLREQGRHDEAARLLDEALTLARQAGDKDPGIAGLQVNLARVHLARNKAAAAEPLLRDALRRQQDTLPPAEWRLAATRRALAEALMALGRYREAEPLLIEAAAVLKDVPGRQGREAAATRNRLVSLYEALRQPAKAAPYRSASR